MECVLRTRLLFLFTRRKFSSMKDLAAVARTDGQAGKPLLIIAEGRGGEALATAGGDTSFRGTLSAAAGESSRIWRPA